MPASASISILSPPIRPRSARQQSGLDEFECAEQVAIDRSHALVGAHLVEVIEFAFVLPVIDETRWKQRVSPFVPTVSTDCDLGGFRVFLAVLGAKCGQNVGSMAWLLTLVETCHW